MMNNARSRFGRLLLTTLFFSTSIPAPGSGVAGVSQRVKAPERAALSEPDQAAARRLADAYGKLPLSFEANQGQTDARVKFLSRADGYTLFLTAAEAVLALKRQPARSGEESGQGKNNPKSKIQNRKSTVLRMQFVGANPEPEIVGLNPLSGKTNYLIGNDSSGWHTNVSRHASVKYEGIYPGIDLVFYGNQRKLEYDFVVAPGADPSMIKLGFEGADRLEVDARGDLMVATPGGPVQMRRPFIYQEIDGIRKQISGSYLLNPKSRIANPHSEISNPKSKIENPKSELVGFQVAAYDSSRPLIIDPVLIYSTYLGGSGDDAATGIAVSNGTVYVTGSTSSTDFPTTGLIQPNYGGGVRDAFVARLDFSGSALSTLPI